MSTETSILTTVRMRLRALPALGLLTHPSPVEPLDRLAAQLDAPTRLWVKRDDAIGFGFGGNKVRKLDLVGAEAKRLGADTLITSGGVQSNHARATAAVAARLGMRCLLVANGTPPERPTANALLDRLLGADVHFVASRQDRAPRVQQIAAAERDSGRHPFVIPIGASTPLGACAYALAFAEMLEQMEPPARIVVATSSGGTQAGLIAGCLLAGCRDRTSIVGVSADDPAESIAATIRTILAGMEEMLAAPRLFAGAVIDIDDTQVGPGYGIATPASRAALESAARCEAIFLDPTYTAKAMAGLIARVRDGRLADGSTLFWHTGGQTTLFAEG